MTHGRTAPRFYVTTKQIVDAVPDDRSRRERIEAAARQEFAELGFHGARIARIAQAAAVNKQLIYYYFGSKRALYEHVLRRATEDLRIAPAERRRMTGSPGERLQKLLVQSMERAAANPDIVRAALVPTERGTRAGREALIELAEEFGREISRGQGLGYFRDDADPVVLGRQAASLVLGWVALTDAPAASDASAERDAWAGAATELLGRALAW